MNEKELQAIIHEKNSDFRMIIENVTFKINEIDVYQTDNPVTEPTTRGGVYFAEMKELKIKATILDTKVSRYLSKAMLGPNKDFLDIELMTKMKEGGEMTLITNLTNSMQNASKVVLYLTLKDAIIES